MSGQLGMSKYSLDLFRSIKSMGYSKFEILVRNVTANNDHDPVETDVNEVIRKISVGSNNFAAASDIIWRRINDVDRSQHVRKSLYLLARLLKEGENKEMFVMNARDRIKDIVALKNFSKFGEDVVCASIRETATCIHAFLVGGGEYKCEDNRVVMIEDGVVAETIRAESALSTSTSMDSTTSSSKKKKKKKKKKRGSVSSNDDFLIVAPGDFAQLSSAPPTGNFEPAPRSSGDDVDSNNGTSPVKDDPLDLFAMMDVSSQPYQPIGSSDGVKKTDTTAQTSTAATQAESTPFDQVDATSLWDTHDPFDRLHSPKHDEEETAALTSSFRGNKHVDGSSTTPVKPVKAKSKESKKPLNTLLGDMGSLFGQMDEVKDAPKKKSKSPRLAGITRMDSEVSITAIPAPAPLEKEEVLAAAPATKAQVVRPPPRQIESAWKKLNSSHASECGAYARLFNALLAGDADVEERLPLNEDGSNLFVNLSDGVILAKFINIIHPGCVDLRTLQSHDDNDSVEDLHTVNSICGATRSLGVKPPKNMTTLRSPPQHPLVVLTLVARLVKFYILRDVDVISHPECAVLTGADARAFETLSLSSPENLLHQWFKYHLAQAGIKEALNLKESIHYGVLIQRIFAFENKPPVVDVQALRNESSMSARAKAIIKAIRPMGLLIDVQPKDVLNANPRLNVALCAALFRHCTALSLSPVVEQVRPSAFIVKGNREVQMFSVWMNSLEIPEVQIQHLVADCITGVTLLKVIEFVEPGTVAWSKVTMAPKNRFQMINNCNYVIDCGRKLRLTLVNISGVDIVDGSLKLLLAFAWQLMRYHMLKCLPQSQNADGSRHKRAASFVDRDKAGDQMIIDWANRVVAMSDGQHPPVSPIKSFSDAHLRDSKFLLSVVTAKEPRAVGWQYYDASSEESRLTNARYTINCARKLGAVLFLLPEDIVEGNQNMIMAFLATMMAL